MRLMEIALDCIRRGWYVFPCKPKTKAPHGGLAPRGFKDASNDEAVIRQWWAACPDANVAIATGPSGLCVVDVDHGIKDVVDLVRWMTERGLPPTYWVRTGRRPEFGAQLYYSGEGLKSTGWRLEDASGDIRCSTGYVMAAGSIHPDSGEAYEVLCNDALSPVPDAVQGLTAKASDPSATVTVDDETAEDWKLWLLEYMARNQIEPRDYEKRAPKGYWLGIHCPWESQHGSGTGAESSTVLGILDGKIAFECSHGTCKINKHDTAAFKQLMTLMHGEAEREPGAEPEIVLGSMTHLPMPKDTDPKDWRELLHTKDEALNAPPVTFLIDGFLQREGVTAIAGPVRERKSLIALNLAHALLTGEKLFDHFAVVKKPERVLYLCPEVSLGPFTDRLKKIGLLDYVGESLFYRTLSADGHLTLNAPELQPALPGAVVILDTAIRFFEGDENSSQDVRAFADGIFALLQGGAESVVMLHHSPKDSGDVMTLENAMRGSGDMGAFLACCWGTRLQDPTHPYESASFMSNLKQRDFESKDFEGHMHT